MGKVIVEARVRMIYDVDRDKKHPEDLRAEVERKVTEALEPEGAELDVQVVARDT